MTVKDYEIPIESGDLSVPWRSGDSSIEEQVKDIAAEMTPEELEGLPSREVASNWEVQEVEEVTGG
jgi:hypothetical protein